MVRRFIHGTFWLKVLAIGLVFAGLSEKSASLITGGLALLVAAKQVRDGIREQVWESPEDQAARHWEDLVWGHSQWVNPETPDEGIKRLSGPFHPVSAAEPVTPCHKGLHKYHLSPTLKSTFRLHKSTLSSKEDYSGPHFIR